MHAGAASKAGLVPVADEEDELRLCFPEEDAGVVEAAAVVVPRVRAREPVDGQETTGERWGDRGEGGGGRSATAECAPATRHAREEPDVAEHRVAQEVARSGDAVEALGVGRTACAVARGVRVNAQVKKGTVIAVRRCERVLSEVLHEPVAEGVETVPQDGRAGHPQVVVAQHAHLGHPLGQRRQRAVEARGRVAILRVVERIPADHAVVHASAVAAPRERIHEPRKPLRHRRARVLKVDAPHEPCFGARVAEPNAAYTATLRRYVHADRVAARKGVDPAREVQGKAAAEVEIFPEQPRAKSCMELMNAAPERDLKCAFY